MLGDLAPHRVGPLLLAGEQTGSVAGAVRHLGAVQAQEHVSATWSLGRRAGIDLAGVVDALRDPSIVRTHVLRTTWHLVHAADLPTRVHATQDRVLRLVIGNAKTHGMGESSLLAAADVALESVRRRPGSTRDDVVEDLDAAGFEVRGNLLAHVLMVPEVRGQIGGMRLPGEPHRYRPLDLVLPVDSVDEARADLARTYARGHGPITERDLAWWSSLTVLQARTAIADADLRPTTIAGREVWTVDEPVVAEVPPVLLLSNYDESISYVREPEVRAALGPAYEVILRATGLLLVDGRLAGHWTRTVGASHVDVVVTPARPLTRTQRGALDAEVAEFGRFVAREPRLVVRDAT